MDNKISFSDKILIAGSRGMVGSAINRILTKKGYGNSLYNGKIYTPTRKELDYLNQNNIYEWFQTNNPDIVIIAAAKVGGIIANATNPADFILENLKIQTNLIETSWKFGVKRLLFLGSSCIYPKFAKQPIREEYLLDGNLEKTNESYAIAKIAGMKLCEALRKQYGFDAISLMPTNLYGTGDNYDPLNSHVMPALIRKFCVASKNSSPTVSCWGSGKVMREFLHVDDLAYAAIFVLEKWDPEKQLFRNDDNGDQLFFLNVGTGKDISIKDLSEKIARYTNFKGNILWDESKPDGTPRKLLNIERIKGLGWEPKINLDYGIKQTISEFKLISK